MNKIVFINTTAQNTIKVKRKCSVLHSVLSPLYDSITKSKNLLVMLMSLY